MRELEPVADVRVFVPEPGDVILRCSSCGGDAGIVAGNTEVGVSEMSQIPTDCCAAERVARPV